MSPPTMPCAQQSSSSPWGQDTLLAAGVLAGCLASRLKGSSVAVVAAVGLLAWRLLAQRKSTAAAQVLSKAEEKPQWVEPKLDIPEKPQQPPRIEALPSADLAIAHLSEFAPSPVMELSEPHRASDQPKVLAIEALPVEPHWADLYLKPSSSADIALELAASSSEELVQPTAEMLAPASWLLGVEPMPLVDETSIAEVSKPPLEVDAPLPILDMDMEPNMPHWSPPTKAREATVAEIPDSIELLILPALEPASMSLSSLLVHKPDDLDVDPQGHEKQELPGLTRLGPKKLASASVLFTPIELKGTTGIETIPALSVPPHAEISCNIEASTTISPNPSAPASVERAPSVLTALGVKTLSNDLESIDLVTPRTKTQLPPPRPQTVSPKSTVPTVITTKVGFSAASKAIALTLPKVETSTEKSEPPLAPPPPRTIPRAPVSMPNPQPSSKSSASWLSFWK